MLAAVRVSQFGKNLNDFGTMNIVKVLAISFIFVVGATAGIIKESQDENHSGGKTLSFLDDEMTEVMKVCNESFPTPMSFLEELNRTTSLPPEAKQEQKCYIRCILEHLEVVNEKGEVQTHVADEIFPKEPNRKKEIEESVRKCINYSELKSEKNLCDRAYIFATCLLLDERSRYRVDWDKLKSK